MSNITDDDRRKYAYEKAIEAYWKHVDRYHTWMNYYSLFNGALFVGFCTIITATTSLKIGMNKIEFENNLPWISIVICLIGLIASLAWRNSIMGHLIWEKNWMNIVCSYESEPNRVYSVLITKSNEIFGLQDNHADHRLTKGEKYKNAYSTHALTKKFIESIIVGWGICIGIVFFVNYNFFLNILYKCNCALYIIVVLILFYVIIMGLIIYLITLLLDNNDLLSDVEGKYWKELK